MRNKPNPFKLVQEYFDQAAEFLGLEPAMVEFLRWPQREYKFTIPIRMDSGAIRVFHGYQVQYNDARGPNKSGYRWHPDETMDTARALAATMTWKTALVDLPLGGGSGGVTCNPKEFSTIEKERLARAWMRVMACELGEHRDSPSPEIYTNPQVMAWMLDEFEAITGCRHPSAITGKPLGLGGSLGRLDATARGGVIIVREACRTFDVDPTGSFAIQGFGNAGQNVALLHPEILGGGKLVAVSDSKGGVYNPNGLDPQALVQYKRETGQVSGFPGATPIFNEDLLELDVDVLYPAAVENVITEINAERIRARIICELATSSTTPNADRVLHVKGLHILPDFLANAGAVVVSYFEQVQGACNYYWTREQVHQQLDAKMTQAFQDVLNMRKQKHVHMRLAAYLVAIHRVAECVRLRGWV